MAEEKINRNENIAKDEEGRVVTRNANILCVLRILEKYTDADHPLTQEQIAQLLKITRPQYSLYETGKRDIPVDLLRILAKFYNISIDFIVGDTDIMERYPESRKKKRI
jgi:plasmid maintenance system antidote protein VapI